MHLQRLIRALGVLAILLACMLIWVLQRRGKTPPIEDDHFAATGVFSPDVFQRLRDSGLAPFEYRVVSVEEVAHDWGPQLEILLETTVDVAKQVTEADLRELWQHVEPSLGNRRVFLWVETDVPGANPWGVISRIYHKLGGKGEADVNFIISESVIDLPPYCFMERIDRSKEGQEGMIVTLPMVNRLHERLVRQGWTVKARTEDRLTAQLHTQDDNTLWPTVQVTAVPDGFTITTYRADQTTLIDAMELVFAELRIFSLVKAKLYTVIGSPEYLQPPDGWADWSWKVGVLEVT